MVRETLFRGVPVQIVPARVRERKADRFYYEIRHADSDWATPATLEEKVAVNFGGTVISPKKLEFGEDDYLELTDAETKTILVDDEDDTQDEANT